MIGTGNQFVLVSRSISVLMNPTIFRPLTSINHNPVLGIKFNRRNPIHLIASMTRDEREVF
jgi:hypothetical protein